MFLACRPINNKFENLGRETFLMPVRWSEDGFPYMTQENEEELLVNDLEDMSYSVNNYLIYG